MRINACVILYPSLSRTRIRAIALAHDIKKNDVIILVFRAVGRPHCSSGSRRVGGNRTKPQPPLDVASLDRSVQGFLSHCVTPSTRLVYASAERWYRTFCSSLPLSPAFPVSEQTLERYVGFLAQRKLKHRTIQSYLSGLQFTQIQLGLGDPFQGKAMPLLEYVLTGIKQRQAKGGTPTKPCLLITPDILKCLRRVWCCPNASHDDHKMLWRPHVTFFIIIPACRRINSAISS